MMNAVHMAIGFGAFVFGIWIGSEAYNQSWIKDCNALGMHRTNDAVYQCKPASKQESAR